MKICFPVASPKGLESEVYGHFGSAPVFIVVETDTNVVRSIQNNDEHHEHGACNPVKALNNEKVDAIVVGGIGMGALMKLQQAGIKVFQAKAQTVGGNITLLKDQKLPEFHPQFTCAGHGHGGGCGH
ncbi:MAG: NifB/NifX family molybdenum-iron cluster-binding protein [Thermodesulfovibrionales bacterium]|nr:NifB/NifX family molybdenum-iron cluster-binding protein [Thermodesulfovibrionales bacterium]